MRDCSGLLLAVFGCYWTFSAVFWFGLHTFFIAGKVRNMEISKNIDFFKIFEKVENFENLENLEICDFSKMLNLNNDLCLRLHTV